ncbi:MAG: AAA family ATPase [Alphaproteobacteria bacterium]|nr:AAA family ATPase [Alphaproteobacteria bacterium]
MSWTLIAKNYRGLREVAWSPQPGLNLLMGGNGAGKTTLLFVPAILRTALDRRRGLPAAIEAYGGHYDLKHLDAEPDQPIVLGVEHGGVRWALEPTPNGSERPAEQVWVSGRCVGRRAPGATTAEVSFAEGVPWTPLPLPMDSVLQQVRNMAVGSFRTNDPTSLTNAPVGPLSELTDALADFLLYYDPAVVRLRQQGSPATGDTALDPDGDRAFSVLRNWRDRAKDRDRYDFVLDGLRACFDWFEDLEYEASSTVVNARLIERGYRGRSFGVRYAPNGWFRALYNLAAVASAPEGGLVAVDEPENSLHPAALRRLLDHVKDYAEELGLTVLFASQSETALDWVDPQHDRIWLMEGGRTPRPLSAVHDARWLNHFRLGELYRMEQLQGPAGGPSARGGTRRPYLEKEHGDRAMRALSVPEATRPGPHAGYLRALVDDVADMLGVPSPASPGVLAPLTARPERLLRNL